MKTHFLTAEQRADAAVRLLNRGYSNTIELDGSITVADPVYGYKNGKYMVTNHQNVKLTNSGEVHSFLSIRS